MKEALNAITLEAKEAVAAAQSEAEIEAVRVKYLGKKANLPLY